MLIIQQSSFTKQKINSHFFVNYRETIHRHSDCNKIRFYSTFSEVYVELIVSHQYHEADLHARRQEMDLFFHLISELQVWNLVVRLKLWRISCTGISLHEVPSTVILHVFSHSRYEQIDRLLTFESCRNVYNDSK